jgi:hypothetical protein
MQRQLPDVEVEGKRREGGVHQRIRSFIQTGGVSISSLFLLTVNTFKNNVIFISKLLRE